MVVVEDHYPAGGIGSAVLEALNDAGHPVQISHLAVRGLPGSGTPEELMRAAGISADRVVEAARKVLAARRVAPNAQRVSAIIAEAIKSCDQ